MVGTNSETMAALAHGELAQAPAPQRHEASPSASQTEPWLQELPARRGLGPRPKAVGEGVVIDINSATLKELIGLKGIGRTRAMDIIKGRPYYDKHDLLKRNVLPPGVYDEIKDAIVAGHG